MLSIQEIGKEILTDHPKKFYFLCGDEFGVKCKYIDHLKNFYKGNVAECPTIESVLNLFERKTLFPTPETLYIVRYDDQFISRLSTIKDADRFEKIRGTLVCIYSSEKEVAKLDKLFPNNTASIDKVASQYIVKYLRNDFPELPESVITIVSQICTDYNQGKLMCSDLMMLSSEKQQSLTLSKACKLFGVTSKSAEQAFRLNIAGKCFSNLIKLLDVYTDDPQSIFYIILQTMIELDKIYDVKWANSDIKEYKGLWRREDIYYMFSHTYAKLKDARSTTTDVRETLVLLFSLLNYERIPSVDQLL